MNYTIVLFEKKIKKEYKAAMDEYLKRLSAYGTVCVQVEKKQGNLKKYIQKPGKHILIREGKDTFESTCLADKIEYFSLHGESNITFYIGDIEDRDELETWNLSSFKMDMDLTATILLEQIYRSYRIIHHQAYHK